MPSPGPRVLPLRVLATAYLPLLIVATWAVVARVAGAPVPWWVLVPAGGWLMAAVVLAAACAAHALLQRRWRWGVALLGLWPLAVPLYLWRAIRPT